MTSIKNSLPNLVTMTAACAGIVSISLASEGRFERALVALLIACVCDGLDGRVARLLNASSKLGAQLDSLADFVNFGVAPALLMYYWMTGGPAHRLADGSVVSSAYIRLVLGCALFYALCDCFRLARFNTMLDKPQLPYWKHFFTGVPAPGGCWMVLTPVMLAIALGESACMSGWRMALQNPYTGVVMLVTVGLLMASRLPTISLKKIHVRGKGVVVLGIMALLLIAVLITCFWLTLGILGVVYFLSVPVCGIVFLRLRARCCR